MSAYYFIENKNPTSDPNIDLNFDNDLLYSDIIADDFDKYREAHVIDEDIAPLESVRRQSYQKQEIKQNNPNIYVIFIIIIIVSIFLWYMYGKSNNDLTKNNTISYTSPDIVMLSPDFGNGVRFGFP